MKFLKLSLAASVALGALSTASFAQPLEEAIKGVDVSGYLRYRYTDDRRNDDYGNYGKDAKHQWKAQADLKTPVMNSVAVNLGVLYDTSNNVNHGKGNDGISGGLGAGGDEPFEVQTFYATITPDSTATTVMVGKQLINSPITSAGDGDRGTGIVAMNNDIEGLTLAAAVFDSWMTDDFDALKADKSIAKNLYALAGVYNTETSIGNIGFQLWGFNVTDMVDALIFTEASWKNSMFRAKVQYSYASLDNGEDSVFASLKPGTTYASQKPKNIGNIAEDNDLFIIEGGVNFSDFNVPLDIRLGYITNFQDGTVVSLNDDSSNLSKAGKLWYQGDHTGFSTSAPYNKTGYYESTDANVIYSALGYKMVDDRLNLGLELAYGTVEREGKVLVDKKYKNRTVSDITFTEIAPTISWKHSDRLTLSAFYAYLSAEQDVREDKLYGTNNGFIYDTANKKANDNAKDYDRQRVRFEAKYSF